MGRKRTPGPRLRRGIWQIDKVIFGQRVIESTRTGKLEEAERYLAHRMESIRQASVYGVRPRRLFKEAAAKHLNENMHKRSIADDASRLRGLIPFIGDMPLHQIHDGTLSAYVDDCMAKGLKKKTINNGLEVVRRILNRAARKWRDAHGLTWLETPPLLSMLEVNDARRPYPLSWEEQKSLLTHLPEHLSRMALFKVNTGSREQEVCQLRWDWEIQISDCLPRSFWYRHSLLKTRRTVWSY